MLPLLRSVPSWIQGLTALSLFAVLSTGCGSSYSPDALFAEAQHHEAAGRFQEALHWYQRASHSGHTDAQYHLAHILRTGTFTNERGHPRGYIGSDTTAAREWFEQAAIGYSEAARQNDAEARMHLGEMYYGGYGVARDTSRAFDLWHLAAEQGHAEAAYRLGLVRFEAERYRAAIPLIRQAAEQEHARAQSLLAFMYQDGFGVPTDYDVAQDWLKRAITNGDSSAVWQLRALKRRHTLPEPTSDGS